MSATRRQIGRLAPRKAAARGVNGVSSSPSVVMADTAVVSTTGEPIDPVCADPAVVLWDEVAAPDPTPSEDAATGQPSPAVADRALH